MTEKESKLRKKVAEMEDGWDIETCEYKEDMEVLLNIISSFRGGSNAEEEA